MSDKAQDTEPMEEVGILQYFVFLPCGAPTLQEDLRFWLACATTGVACLGTYAALCGVTLAFACNASQIQC